MQVFCISMKINALHLQPQMKVPAGQPETLAGVVKLVDIPDLGSGAARHGGSSPSTRTSLELVN